MSRLVRILLLTCAGIALLSGCRVDVTAEVAMKSDGSGTLTVTLTADAEVVQAAGGLDGDLRFDDLEAVGWRTEGPTVNDDGGLQVVLTHSFSAPGEATALLASLNGSDGPFKSVLLTRTRTDQAITFTMNGSGRVDAGLAAFADAGLVAAVGATPYADDIAAVGLSQSDAVVVTLRISLPGAVVNSTGTPDGGALTWVVPLDSTPVDLSTTTRQSLERGGLWAVSAIVLQVLLVVWILVVVVVVAMVLWARFTRDRRRGSPTRGGNRPRRPLASVASQPGQPGRRGPRHDDHDRDDAYDAYDDVRNDDRHAGTFDDQHGPGDPSTGSVGRVGGSGLGEIRARPRPKT